MTTYITQDGTTLTANSTVELFEQLQPLKPQISQVIPNLNLNEPKINLDHTIAQLIQADYLRMIDVIDG
jgi:hypothetical protein